MANSALRLLGTRRLGLQPLLDDLRRLGNFDRGRPVDAGLDGGLQTGLRFESMAFGLTAASEDRREGTTAFLEKRKAVFTGR